MVEVATIGREGMVGVFATTVHSVATSGTMVQAEMGTCYRMTSDAFRGEMDRRGAFYELLTNYAQALLGFIMQSTACNAVHSVEQRLARWLLLAEDRVGRSDFPLTQEFVAIMLGTTRPTVTVVAGTLQRAGLIKYHRGHVTILDREKLESASCECYQVATDLLHAVTDESRGVIRRIGPVVSHRKPIRVAAAIREPQRLRTASPSTDGSTVVPRAARTWTRQTHPRLTRNRISGGDRPPPTRWR